jgi:hypothetical protein
MPRLGCYLLRDVFGHTAAARAETWAHLICRVTLDPYLLPLPRPVIGLSVTVYDQGRRNTIALAIAPPRPTICRWAT